jgi:hypothetical protein
MFYKIIYLPQPRSHEFTAQPAPKLDITGTEAQPWTAPHSEGFTNRSNFYMTMLVTLTTRRRHT